MLTLRHTALTAAVCLALAACGQQTASTADTATAGGEITVTIATANPLTGPFAHWGKDAADGVKLAVDEANAKGTQWNGQKVVFKYLSEDDQGDPKTAATVATGFVDKKVNVVVGHLTTGPSMVASKVYNENGIPEIVYSVTGPQFTQQGYKGAFRVIANDSQQGVALADYAVNKLGVKNFAVVQDKTAYGEGLANDFAKSAQAAGAKLIDTQYTTNSATEFGAIVTALKANNPDLVFYGGMDAQAAPLLREMRRQGLEAKFMGADGVQTPEFLSLAKEAAEGAYASTTGMPKEQMPGYATFSEAYKKAYQQEIVAYSPYAYDATNVVIAAMNKAQSGEPAKYLPELAATDHQGVTGQIQFQENGDIQNGVVTLYVGKNGQWEVLQ
ncbi:MAG: branched-chain amino acid ABC transporter substrate-binding protein [Neisseria sp.]|nr:branched-chain amino acid ABC transporter substrate-binding protein [Neisseria sp.]